MFSYMDKPPSVVNWFMVCGIDSGLLLLVRKSESWQYAGSGTSESSVIDPVDMSWDGPLGCSLKTVWFAGSDCVLRV